MVKDLHTLIDRRAMLNVEKLTIYVKVVDIRQVWGKTQALVIPNPGQGEQWVELGRLRFEQETSA
jgi:hypothetical protein